MTMVRDILMYMDRTYVTQKRKLPVYDSGLYIFRDVIVRHECVRDRLRARLLLCIERERHGELIDRDLIKSILRMLVDLGVHSNAVYRTISRRFSLIQRFNFIVSRHKRCLKWLLVLNTGESIAAIE